MNNPRLRALVLQHAEMLAEEARLRRASVRLAKTDPERAELSIDEADDKRFRADALAELLEMMGVYRPEPKQMALMGLGDVT